MKPVGKPDAGNRHVRFDERGEETERSHDTAPLLDSTFLGPQRGVQTIQAAQYARLHLGVDLRRPTFLPKLGEALAFEVSDHAGGVSYLLTYVN
ncbi:MAG: hypothetical protein WBM24_26160 [Candidatus Sulfotelmatobacter sp.]